MVFRIICAPVFRLPSKLGLRFLARASREFLWNVDFELCMSEGTADVDIFTPVSLGPTLPFSPLPRDSVFFVALCETTALRDVVAVG